MELTIKRKDADGVQITSNRYGLVMIFQGVTVSDYKELYEGLQDYFGAEPVALYYNWKNTSIFIFDPDVDEISNEMKQEIREIVGKRRFSMVFNGKQEKGSTLSELHVRSDKNGIFVGKQFMGILTMEVV